ncbi:pectinesterase inhibitor-like [Primulina eburnea]|uniref:pectinesterase inhibitor-like n=1 Tax=Primulina eburnea TaxID=1245227 RepID=UPI003C6C3D90
MANLIGIISIAVILMFAIPASLARHHRDKDKDGDLRDLCSKTHDPELCWKLLIYDVGFRCAFIRIFILISCHGFFLNTHMLLYLFQGKIFRTMKNPFPKLLKPERSRFHTDTTGVVEVAIKFAKGIADEIQDKISRLGEESNNEKMKEKYWSCSKNYGDAIRDLNEAKRMLRKREYSAFPVLVDDVIDELKSCHNNFDNGTFDPAHIQNRNVEFRVYADLLKVAVDCLLKERRD